MTTESLMRRLARQTRAAALAEYVILLVIVALAAISIVVLIGNGVAGDMNSARDALSGRGGAIAYESAFMRGLGETGTQASSTQTTANFSPETEAGDFVMVFVMHRADLVTPPGWDVVSSESVAENHLTQRLTILSKTYQSSDGSGLALSQATAQRFIATAVTVSGEGAQVASVASTAGNDVRKTGISEISNQDGTLVFAAATTVSLWGNPQIENYVEVFPQSTWTLLTDRARPGNRLGIAAAWAEHEGEVLGAPVFIMDGVSSHYVVTTVQITGGRI